MNRMIFGYDGRLKDGDIVPDGESFKALIIELESRLLDSIPSDAKVLRLVLPDRNYGYEMADFSSRHPNFRILVAGDLETGERFARVECLVEEPTPA